MTVGFPFFVMLGSVVIALVLSGVENSSSAFSDVNLPYGFNIPMLIAFSGSIYLILSKKGFDGVLLNIAGAITFSVITVLLVKRGIQGKDDAEI